jgi:hypothetical protein
MRGVAYQQEINSNTSATSSVKYTDPLSDTTSCKRDIEFLKKVRTNTIRVYAINPDEDHDECMNALADAGIYVVADLSEPGLYVLPLPHVDSACTCHGIWRAPWQRHLTMEYMEGPRPHEHRN